MRFWKGMWFEPLVSGFESEYIHPTWGWLTSIKALAPDLRRAVQLAGCAPTQSLYVRSDLSGRGKSQPCGHDDVSRNSDSCSGRATTTTVCRSARHARLCGTTHGQWREWRPGPRCVGSGPQTKGPEMSSTSDNVDACCDIAMLAVAHIRCYRRASAKQKRQAAEEAL